ncbi:MAG: polyketide synthase dehydratase domain-containing protein [Burkholderiales bacterium]|nr:polyketide synthase dehydratase domain-containing protein [Burkholderiales bacterium]
MAERDVAIIGMACIFPKAPDLAAFWRNVRDGVDAITEVPPARWDPLYYDPASTAPDRFYARRGGFIDEYAEFDPTAYGIMPVAAQGAEPDQLLALDVAVAAMRDAGYDERPFARETTSVIVGRGNYLGPGIVRLVDITRGAQQLIDALTTLVPGLHAAQLAHIKQAFQARCGVYGADTAIGLVPNLVASRIANRLDLGGSAYTVDAACASTLVAVDHACRELREGSADLAIVGGVHLCHDVAFWSVFSQLGALSRRQQIRPFDQRADGLLIGEGVGMVVLKRMADARRDDDRVYAVIRGTGVASDGRDVSLLTPRVDGQLLALTRAWKAAGLDPATVGLVEAHGTATSAGDAAEIETLSRFFGAADPHRDRVPLGSVKSMIGHAMPAAGAAGLIKAALAAYHGVHPPTLHCDDPLPAITATRFRIPCASAPWDDGLRRAAVNAFGFGGINGHVILDGPEASRPHGRARASAADGAHALVCAAATREELVAALTEGRSGGAGPWRAAVLDPTPERVASAVTAAQAGRARRGRDGIYVAPRGLVAQGGKVAFLFPGVEAGFAPRVDDIASHFGVAMPALAAPDLEHQGAAVIRLNHFLADVLAQCGIRPDAIAGHSIGEWSGMLAAGMVDGTLDAFVAELEPGTLEVAAVSYLAAGAGADRLRELTGDVPELYVSHDNCAHQAILCGTPDAIDDAARRLRAARILFEILPFRSGFHSPALAEHVGFYMRQMQRFRFRHAAVPMWSATTCSRYPADEEAVRALVRDHLLQPVRFRELVLALYADGVRVFVQVGMGSLCAFVDDVLAALPHHAISVVSPYHPGMAQLERACAAYFVEGGNVDLARAGLVPHPSTRARKAMPLALSVPRILLDLPPLAAASVPESAPGMAAREPRDRVAAAFAGNLREMAAAQDAVADMLSRIATGHDGALDTLSAPAGALERSEDLVLSRATYPELADHCLIPQPPGWSDFEDCAPAVPMTMSVALMMELAQKLDPTRIPVAIENVQAMKWLHVEPPTRVATTARFVDRDRVHVKLGAFVEGTVTLADHHPSPPPRDEEPLRDRRIFPVAAEAIYRDGWLFHGPLYRGIEALTDCGDNGLAGTLVTLPAKGALLDNAGQLVGLWLMQAVASDRLAMPIRIRRIDFFAPEPPPQTRVHCIAWIRHLGRHEVRADLELGVDGRVIARITGWEDWRFQTGGGMFEVMRQPGHVLLAKEDPEGFVVVKDPGWSSAATEFLVRRFLNQKEIAGVGGVREAQRRTEWLFGRIAAKDAIRRRVFARGAAPLYPVEITIESGDDGRPKARGPYRGDLRVSLAHKPGMAVALAAEGADVGIDVEEIVPRGDEFVRLALRPEEVALLPALDSDEWLTRFWAAKEAAGKARGTGLAGDPRSVTIDGVDGERVRAGGCWVETRRRDGYVVAWTVQSIDLRGGIVAQTSRG